MNLSEIFEVSHSCFIIGTAGTAKTAIYTTVFQAYNDEKKETAHEIVDPKAVNSDELFGCMNPKTKEWKDGVLSVIMRN